MKKTEPVTNVTKDVLLVPEPLMPIVLVVFHLTSSILKITYVNHLVMMEIMETLSIELVMNVQTQTVGHVQA